MKNQLINLYKENWENLKTAFVKILEEEQFEQKPTNPLLIYLNEKEYLNADIKVMIFGQETNDWGKNFNGQLVETLEIYDEFYNTGYAINNYGGHFWNGYNRFINLLKKNYKDKKICTVWNNIVKIGASGRDQNHPKDYIYDVEIKNFLIIEKEINVLKPDIILFLTGPNYDSNIKNHFHDVQFMECDSKFSTRQISELKIQNSKNVFRTYHPNYLWRNNIDLYFNTIIENIKI